MFRLNSFSKFISVVCDLNSVWLTDSFLLRSFDLSCSTHSDLKCPRTPLIDKENSLALDRVKSISLTHMGQWVKVALTSFNTLKRDSL